MIEITAVKMQGGEDHDHIAAVKWRNTSTLAIGQSTTQAIIDWLGESQANQAVVAHNGTWVYVRVMFVEGKALYLRTYADGQWQDNLLALPRFE
jgi:Protein of unknown function (DUF3892)